MQEFLATNIRAAFRQAAEKDRLAACAPQNSAGLLCKKTPHFNLVTKQAQIILDKTVVPD